MVLKFGYVLVIMMTFTKVCPWTIDLPEVRRYLFEKMDKEKNDYKDYISNKKTYYDNVDPNSLHTYTAHEDHSNVEKEVLDVVRYGGAYLEGLRRAVERYIDFLENCTSTNNTRINVSINATWLPQSEVGVANVTTPINGGGNDQFAINQTEQRFVESQNNTNIGKGTLDLCQNVTRTSEYVRRVAQLAVWTTKRLQDLVYAEEYQHDNGKEEDELIFKLAWFLDRLAKMTGYIPDPKSFIGEERRETTTTIPFPNPPIPTSVIPEDVKRNMMNCIKQESPIPATIRCAFPLPLPPGTAELFNLTDIASTPQPQTVSDIPQPPAGGENVLQQDAAPGQPSSELLTAVESVSHLLKSRILNPSRNYQRRDVNLPNSKTLPELSDLTSVKTVKKRSINENPLINLMKYYVKHSAWVNSNPTNNLQSHLSTNDDKTFDVANHLTEVKSVQKRSVVYNKNNQVRIPEIPMPDLSKYIKNKPGIHYLRDHVVMQKIKNILERMHNRRILNGKNKLATPFRIIKKRSLHYEHMYLPRESENPKQDISYYVKNKDGTDYNPSLLQVAQARAALERHFLTSNIVTVRQYGSNYNPLVPAPLFAGIVMTLADS